MNEDIKTLILNEIKASDTILIARHFRPDGDAIGSSKGLQRILKLSFPEKDIRLCNRDYSDYLSFLGPEDGTVSDEDIKKALVLILDTATADRASEPRVFGGRKVIKIDHHIDNNPYGDLAWVEEKRSSTSELIADFYVTFRNELKIDSYAATCLYTGINTDSGRFCFASTTGETLRLAGMLLDMGVDIENLQANLDLREFKFYEYQADVLSRIKMTDNGLAYLFIDRAMHDKWSLSREEASDSVIFMNRIKGAIAWIAFIENPDHTIRVRLRSRFMTINAVAEKYHGGGHDRASGATCYSKEEMEALIRDADEAVREYKESHDTWL